MKIRKITLHSYENPLANGQMRQGVLVNIIDQHGVSGWGDVAPLPGWSQETLEESVQQLNQKCHDIIDIEWNVQNCLEELAGFRFFPAASFGVESALLVILNPLSEHAVSTSALLAGSPQEIIKQAHLRYDEGYTSAKLKVGHFSFEEAAHLIHALKDKFSLRIDVNRAWTTSDSLRFFSQFPLETFDYVEEPFQNPHDLDQFPHPLAVDESFPKNLSLAELASLPTLKALIYKPTIQGGMLGCLPLHEWTKARDISLVLSSSFESDVGLAHVASIAYRLSLSAPVGIGTYHYLKNYLCTPPLKFHRSFAYIPAQLTHKPQ